MVISNDAKFGTINKAIVKALAQEKRANQEFRDKFKTTMKQLIANPGLSVDVSKLPAQLKKPEVEMTAVLKSKADMDMSVKNSEPFSSGIQVMTKSFMDDVSKSLKKGMNDSAKLAIELRKLFGQHIDTYIIHLGQQESPKNDNGQTDEKYGSEKSQRWATMSSSRGTGLI